MPPSLARDPSCLASLPSNSKLLAPLSQHHSSQVAMCSPGWWLKSFRMSHSSPRDRDRVMISGSASFFCSCDGPGSLSSLTGRSDFFAYFFLCTGATDTGTGWLSGSAAVPVAGAGAVATVVAAASAVPAGAAAELVVGSWGSRGACHFVSPRFPFRALNSVEQGSVGVGQTAPRC